MRYGKRYRMRVVSLSVFLQVSLPLTVRGRAGAYSILCDYCLYEEARPQGSQGLPHIIHSLSLDRSSLLQGHQSVSRVAVPVTPTPPLRPGLSEHVLLSLRRGGGLTLSGIVPTTLCALSLSVRNRTSFVVPHPHFFFLFFPFFLPFLYSSLPFL